MTAFTIGDRVRVTRSSTGRTGRIGTIVRVHHAHRHYRNAVRFDDGFTTLYHDQHLELADARDQVDGGEPAAASDTPEPTGVAHGSNTYVAPKDPPYPSATPLWKLAERVARIEALLQIDSGEAGHE